MPEGSGVFTMLRMSCCLLIGSGDYKGAEEQLNLFIGRFDFEREVRPWGCPYRNWGLFVLDTSGMTPSQELENLESLAKLIRSFPARIVGIWSAETFEKLRIVAPEAAYSPNCLLLDTPDWCDVLHKALRRYQRELRGLQDESGIEQGGV
jgi:hypothetical protein